MHYNNSEIAPRVGDLICGIDKNKYSITNQFMTLAEVIEVDLYEIKIRILEHENPEHNGIKFNVNPEYFDFIGSANDENDFVSQLPPVSFQDLFKA